MHLLDEGICIFYIIFSCEESKKHAIPLLCYFFHNISFKDEQKISVRCILISEKWLCCDMVANLDLTSSKIAKNKQI